MFHAALAAAIDPARTGAAPALRCTTITDERQHAQGPRPQHRPRRVGTPWWAPRDLRLRGQVARAPDAEGTDEALDGGAPSARGVHLRGDRRCARAVRRCRRRDTTTSASLHLLDARWRLRCWGAPRSSGARRAPAAARRGDSAKSSACDASRWVSHALGGANAALPRRGLHCVGACASSARESSRDLRDVHTARALRSGRWGERCRRARHGAARASRAGPLRAMRRRRIATRGAYDSFLVLMSDVV